MRKYLPYGIALLVLLILGGIMIANNKKMPRKMDERITLRQSDKIPYGTAVARNLLPALFPGVPVFFDRASPGNWDSVNNYQDNQAVILVSRNFSADEEELETLIDFVKEGNHVFIMAKSFSYEAIEFFQFSYVENSLDEFLNLSEDSLRLKLEKPSFATDRLFIYPGKRYESAFNNLDTTRTLVLGRNEYNSPDFIQLKAGKGSIFIHMAPLAFSNYFILHKDNVQYFQQVMSVIPQNVEKTLWNEYFLLPKTANQKDPDMLRVLMKYPAFKWGLLTGIAGLLLYVLLGMRRRQRMIPLHARPKNDSLDFIKTLGRLYFDRRDHKNLAGKMSAHFLDHVRTKYKLSTQALDEAFVQSLHYKTGYPAAELEKLTDFMNSLEGRSSISEEQLAGFHRQLELFYQNT